MPLRVIGGEAKGLRLRPVPGQGARPVRDSVKQALFNILGRDVEDCAFLDLFAGTGSVGIEALSRGAARTVFVDNSAKAIQTVRANLEHTGLAGRAVVRQGDAFTFLSSPQRERFDYVYVAPPQYAGLWRQALEAIDANIGWLNPDAWVVAQIDKREYLSLELQHMTEFSQRRYGTTLLVFYEWPGD